jgi:hypothetical protein
MSLAYEIDASRRLIVISGEYSNADEWRSLLLKVLSDPHRKPGFAFLRDLRNATTPVDADGVVQIMEVVCRFWPQLQPSRAAIVTKHDDDSAALVAHALADSQQLPIRAFNSYDDALAWLLQGKE